MIENINQYFAKNKNAFYPNGYAKSVHNNQRERFDIAQHEKDKEIVPLESIVKYVNEIFETVGIKRIEYEQAKMNPDNINYKSLQEEYNLNNERDIIWMKFTRDGHLGVVGTSNDVNFDIPCDSSQYDIRVQRYNSYEKRNKEEWKYNTSGILVHSVGEKWDESFVLLFPLEGIGGSCPYNRHEIEIAVGNYLEKMGVPIIDYYSHNY